MRRRRIFCLRFVILKYNMSREFKKKLLLISFCASFLYSLHTYLTMYVNAIYLEKFFTKSEIGLLYTFGGIFSIIFTIYVAKLIRRLHNYKTTIGLVILEIICLLALAFADNLYIIMLSFISHLALVSALLITINLFIEEFEDTNEVGETRGIFITLGSIATIMSTLVAGALVQNYGFEGVYIAAAVVLAPTLFLLQHFYSNVPEPRYKKIDIKKGITEIFENKNIYGIFVAAFAVNIFYIIMTIYTGIYLLQNGITLQTFLTFIMPIALVPFILLPYQLGKIADKKLGEKEMLIAGMFIMGVICILITFFKNDSPLFWAFILFLSRIGAATAEEMYNSYFFKKVKPTDSFLIGLFGGLYTTAMIVAPLFASIILISLELNFIFFFLGIFILLSIFPVLKIVDTK